MQFVNAVLRITIFDFILEYRMDSCCVNCIIEVLVALLEDSNLQLMMAAMKPNLTSIVQSFVNVSTAK